MSSFMPTEVISDDYMWQDESIVNFTKIDKINAKKHFLLAKRKCIKMGGRSSIGSSWWEIGCSDKKMDMKTAYVCQSPKTYIYKPKKGEKPKKGKTIILTEL